jgi:outer membrane protein assembly factor BamB
MSQTGGRGGARWMLWASVALFVLFALLACYHKYRDALSAYFYEQRDLPLMEELAAATIQDEPAPLGAAWPQWRGEHRDGVAYDQNLATDWNPEGLEVLWKIKVGLGFSSFAVCNGRAFTMLREGDQEFVDCLDVNNKGDRIWRFSYPCTYQGDFSDGPRSTPTLDREGRSALSAAAGPYARSASPLAGDRLYTVGADGKFYCLDAVTGDPLWHKELLAEFHADNLQWGVAFSPLIEGNLVITVPGGPNASIVALDKYSGETKWATQSDKAGYASPLAVDAGGQRQILVFAGKGLLSVSAQDGSLNWRVPWSVQADVNAATPTVFHAVTKDGRGLDYVFISSGYAKGSALLKMAADAQGKPTVQIVYQIDKLMKSQFSSPVRRGDYLYGFDDVKLACVDLKTGKTVWSESGYVKGSLLRVGDRLIVLGENGKLGLFEATPEPASTNLEDTRALAEVRDVFSRHAPRCWTMPVLADGKLLLRTEEEIICIDLRKRE